MSARSSSRTPLVAVLVTAAASWLPWALRPDGPAAPATAFPATALPLPGAATALPGASIPTAGPLATAVPAAATATAGPVTLKARLDRALLPVSPAGAEAWLVVSLDPMRRRPDASRLPVNLAIVLDVSGSMKGSKLAEAKRAASDLIARLDARDRVALVAYETKVDVKVPSIPVDDAGKARLLAAVDALTTHGDTNIHAGLLAGRDEVLRFAAPGHANRIVLLSDGKATKGLVRTADGLAALARTIYEDGVAVTSVGVGLDAKVELLMAVARHGGGGYHYVEGASALARVFLEELEAAGTVVARAPWVDITPAPGVEVVELIGHEAERVATTGAARYRVRPGDLRADTERKIVIRLRVPAAAPGAVAVASVLLGYREATVAETAHVAVAEVGTMIVPELAAAEASRDPEATERVVAAELARDLDAAADLHASGSRAAAVERVRVARKRVADEAARGYIPASAARSADIVFEGLEVAGEAPDEPSAKRFLNSSRSAAYEMSY